jgi:murein DD-endopeptidase MepM/ murein hydrolase activator NlpD
MLLSPIQNSGDNKTIIPQITQEFSLNPKIYKKFGLNGHPGIDFRAPVGTKLYAPLSGLAIVKDDGKKTGYGLHIKIRTEDGKEIVLGHLSKALIKSTQKVNMGDLIALTGNTGFSTGPHLHLGLRYLQPSDKPIFSWEVRDAGNGFYGYVDFKPWVICWSGLLISVSN